MNLKPNPEDNGIITKQFLKKLCKTDFKNYYSTPQLNDILYLHYKGFNTIANLHEYTGLKCIYLQGNAIKNIEGLEKLINLRCLYLQENLICKIEGLQNLTELSNLNLSQNLIQKVQGLGNLKKLSNLQLKNNRIGNEGLSDVIGLLECPNISALDISNNKIITDEFLPEVLMKMPQIAVVYLQNNQFTKNISHYRKTLISKIPQLKYIDDKPVFQDEKRFSEAWARGGLQQQRKQRALYKKQKQQQQLRNHQQFRKMLGRHREQKLKNDGPSSQSDSESLQKQSLEIYKSPQDSHENSERTSQKQSSQVASDKEASENQNSEKAMSEKDKNQLPRLQQLQVRVLKAEQKNKSIYLDELD